MLNLKLFGARGAKKRSHPATDTPDGQGADVPDAKLAQTSAASHTPDGKPSMEQENSALDDFIYLVSHDLRASMRALLEVPVWISEDLHDAGIALPEVVKDHMTLLDRHTSRLDRMLCDLLAYSRVGRLQNVVDVDVTEVIGQVLDEVPLPDGWQVHKDIGHTQLQFGDQDILTLFSALISNAVKHSNATGNVIWIKTSQSGDDFVLTVADNGPGIPEEHRSKVFDIMRTLRPRDQVEGSGMGLALVRKLAEIYGGSVSARPADGGSGACIRFVVPAARGTHEIAA